MQALFIGQSYIDITFLADELPTGDEKSVARDYAVSFRRQRGDRGFLLRQARGGARPAGHRRRRLARPHVHRHGGEVRNLRPSPQGEGIVAVLHHAERRPARDRALPRRPFRASVSDAQSCRLPGTACRRPSSPMRPSTTPRSAARPACSPRSTAAGCAPTRTSSLAFIDVAVVAERLCEQMKLTPGEMLHLSALARLQDRRGHARCTRHDLVRRDRPGSRDAGAAMFRSSG